MNTAITAGDTVKLKRRYETLPMLKPPPGELTVECPKCHQIVSETCCAYQDYDYYKDCYVYKHGSPLRSPIEKTEDGA